MFRYTFLVTQMNNIIDVPSAVKRGLFWGNIRKDGHRLLVSYWVKK